MNVVARLSILLFLAAALSVSSIAQVTDALAAMNLGVQQFRLGDFQSAADSFARAKQLDPSLTTADIYLGAAYSKLYIPGNTSAENQEKAKKAIAAYESALALNRTNVDALTGLARFYQLSSNHQKARETYLSLTKATPTDAMNFFSVGATDWLLAYETRNPLPAAERTRVIAEGLDNLDAALRLNSGYGDAMTYKTLLLREKARTTTDPVEAAKLVTEADQWFNRALETRALQQGGNAAGMPVGVVGGVLGGFVGARGAAPPPPPPPPPPPGAAGQAPYRIGGDVAQANLVNKVAPVYPAAARAARVQDYVMLQATIDKAGTVADLKVLHGHPMLNESAIDAVRQWRYQPILLNGQPIEVITTITVNFSFQ